MNARRSSEKTRRFRLRFLRGRRGERGATLVEFALVAVPFFLLVFGILELGFIFWGTHELENATEEAGRQIRTGQTQSKSQSDFVDLVCSRVTLLSQCSSKLQVDVRTFSNFSDIENNSPVPLDGDQELVDNFSFSQGGPRSIVLVSTFYQWPLFTGITSLSLSNMADGDRLLRGSAAFRNEAW
jgi:Flp pilus assembly protein TadG